MYKGSSKENIDMKKCEAYEAVKMSNVATTVEQEYENIDDFR